MHSEPPIKPLHMNATPADVAGNGKLGRYILLPGSDGRALDISKRLANVKVIEHPRRHNFYAGTYTVKGQTIDVGVMSSGMGCPSMDIIATELLQIGAKRIIRVGTAGSLQPDRIRVGHMVIPTAAVRDEGTSRHYFDPAIPVLSSLEFLDVARRAAKGLKVDDKISLGIVHTKDSLYAREFGQGPLAAQHEIFMKHLQDAGVLASEMECAQLFTLLQAWNQKPVNKGQIPAKGGAILAIVGDDQPFANNTKTIGQTVDGTIDFAFACITQWAEGEDAAWL